MSFYTHTGLEFPDSFRILKDSPIDNRSTFATVADRDALKAGQRYEGLLTYVQETSKFYYLGAGLTNADWSLLSDTDLEQRVSKVEASLGNIPTPTFRKITLPKRNNFVLKDTDGNHPTGAFKVKVEILGTNYDGGCFAQYEALYYHAAISYNDGNDDDEIVFAPITPMSIVYTNDFIADNITEPFYKMVNGIGSRGKVGFDLVDGTTVDSEIITLYYPYEVGELVATEIFTGP